MVAAMSTWDLVTLNLGSPAVLAFVLGVLAALMRSDLRFPEQVTSFLSSYLLFAIGLKGGLRIREADIGDLVGPFGATLVLGGLGIFPRPEWTPWIVHGLFPVEMAALIAVSITGVRHWAAFVAALRAAAVTNELEPLIEDGE